MNNSTTDRNISTNTNLESHKIDLKEAIRYLPRNYDFELLCRLLKHVYEDQAKLMAKEWASAAKVSLPEDFDDSWDEVSLNKYQESIFDEYIKEKLYERAEKTGWVPKALRHGKQTQKPPRKRKLKKEEQKIEDAEYFENILLKIKERDVAVGDRSYVPRSIVNLDGACYYHPFMKKEDIPEKRGDYLVALEKLTDCEVTVKEAVEYRTDRPGRQVDEITVKYNIEFSDKNGKQKEAEVSYENLTRASNFSDVLVKHGFTKFKGKKEYFDMFHEFLINEQQYPTLITQNSWGEFEKGSFLFKNGLFDVNDRFYSADEEDKIAYGGNHLLCTNGSEQVRPPVLAKPKSDTQEFLCKAFLLWEDFNGSLNIRTTIGYALAVLFSRSIVQKYKAFPLLFKFGERGTGKSTSMDWFMALFGYENGNRQSVSKQNTEKAIIRRMTFPMYFPFFLDDYRDHNTNNNVPDLTSPILNWYQHIGTGMAKKTTDTQTIDTPMRAAVVMTGNDKPTDPAVLSRMIILNYNRFLNTDQQKKVKFISGNTARLSEFTHLILDNYEDILPNLMSCIEKNKNWLSDQGFEGRTSLIWGIILGANECLPHVLPGLTSWHSNFKALRSNICQKVNIESSLEYQQAALYEFFEALEHFSTMKRDPDYKSTNLLDHRHFRIRLDESVADHNGQVIYQGMVLAVHMGRIWNSLQDVNAAVTKNHSRTKITSMLINSRFFLSKSEQVQLTAEIRSKREKNLRCFYISVEELIKHGHLGDVIEKANRYERDRKERL